MESGKESDGGGGNGSAMNETLPTDSTIVGITAEASGLDAMGATAGDSGTDGMEKGALSPLTGSYLLIVLAEPHSEEDREVIIQRLIKGLKSWDMDSSHVDLTCELLNLANAAPEGDEARNGEKLVQWASENLVVEVLIHCQVNTLLQCMKNLLSSFTRHRHIIHTGYTFQGSGSWILQDGTFSVADFLELWAEPEVTRILGAYKGDISVSIHCATENGWTEERLRKESFSKLCQVRMNPPDKILGHSSGILSFVDYISKMLVAASLKEILEPSEIVGNIRFSHPTLYVFPGGQGDAALFGINGFNMLIDGGFSRRSCFWEFTRHLDRLDAVLLTRVNNNAMCGLDAVLDRKRFNQVHPNIGHFFGNVMERKQPVNEIDQMKSDEPQPGPSSDLLVSLRDTGHRMVENLRNINLKPQHCFRENVIEPINLYHKVGHGKLDMYVLNPAKDSREVREFLSKWHSSDCKSFVQAKMSMKLEPGKEMSYPVLNLVSICALLVWQPDNPREPITRILFPGSTPQQKIFEALGKLKHLEFLKYPICSAKTLAASHKSRARSERTISGARHHLSSSVTRMSQYEKSVGGDQTEARSASVHRAPTYSSASSKYGIRAKLSSTTTRSESTSTVTAETTEKEKDILKEESVKSAADLARDRKSREKERRRTTTAEPQRIISTSKPEKKVASEGKVEKDNMETESATKKREHRVTSRRIDTSMSKSQLNANKGTSSSATSLPSVTGTPKARVASRIDTGRKILPQSPAKKDDEKPKKYGIGTTRSSRTTSATPSSTTSPPSTPPKSAKDAVNRKVVETKTARRSLIDTVKHKEKDKEKPPPKPSKTTTASKAKTVQSTPAPPATAAAPPPTKAKQEPKPVKRPGAVAAAAAIGGAAIAAVAAISKESKEEEAKEESPVEKQVEEVSEAPPITTNGVGSHDESEDKPETVAGDEADDEESSPKTPPGSDDIGQQNGLSVSAAVTESSSEMSSLDHTSVNEEIEDRAQTVSEDVITAIAKDQLSPMQVAELPSESHTISEGGLGGEEDEEMERDITAAGGDVDDEEEEEEYLVIEKDESTTTGGDELEGIDSNIVAEEAENARKLEQAAAACAVLEAEAEAQEPGEDVEENSIEKEVYEEKQEAEKGDDEKEDEQIQPSDDISKPEEILKPDEEAPEKERSRKEEETAEEEPLIAIEKEVTSVEKAEVEEPVAISPIEEEPQKEAEEGDDEVQESVIVAKRESIHENKSEKDEKEEVQSLPEEYDESERKANIAEAAEDDKKSASPSVSREKSPEPEVVKSDTSKDAEEDKENVEEEKASSDAVDAAAHEEKVTVVEDVTENELKQESSKIVEESEKEAAETVESQQDSEVTGESDIAKTDEPEEKPINIDEVEAESDENIPEPPSSVHEDQSASREKTPEPEADKVALSREKTPEPEEKQASREKTPEPESKQEQSASREKTPEPQQTETLIDFGETEKKETTGAEKITSEITSDEPQNQVEVEETATAVKTDDLSAAVTEKITEAPSSEVPEPSEMEPKDEKSEPEAVVEEIQKEEASAPASKEKSAEPEEQAEDEIASVEKRASISEAPVKEPVSQELKTEEVSSVEETEHEKESVLEEKAPTQDENEKTEALVPAASEEVDEIKVDKEEEKGPSKEKTSESSPATQSREKSPEPSISREKSPDPTESKEQDESHEEKEEAKAEQVASRKSSQASVSREKSPEPDDKNEPVAERKVSLQEAVEMDTAPGAKEEEPQKDKSPSVSREKSPEPTATKAEVDEEIKAEEKTPEQSLSREKSPEPSKDAAASREKTPEPQQTEKITIDHDKTPEPEEKEAASALSREKTPEPEEKIVEEAVSKEKTPELSGSREKTPEPAVEKVEKSETVEISASREKTPEPEEKAPSQAASREKTPEPAESLVDFSEPKEKTPEPEEKAEPALSKDKAPEPSEVSASKEKSPEPEKTASREKSPEPQVEAIIEKSQETTKSSAPLSREKSPEPSEAVPEAALSREKSPEPSEVKESDTASCEKTPEASHSREKSPEPEAKPSGASSESIKESETPELKKLEDLLIEAVIEEQIVNTVEELTAKAEASVDVVVEKDDVESHVTAATDREDEELELPPHPEPQPELKDTEQGDSGFSGLDEEISATPAVVEKKEDDNEADEKDVDKDKEDEQIGASIDSRRLSVGTDDEPLIAGSSSREKSPEPEKASEKTQDKMTEQLSREKSPEAVETEEKESKQDVSLETTAHVKEEAQVEEKSDEPVNAAAPEEQQVEQIKEEKAGLDPATDKKGESSETESRERTPEPEKVVEKENASREKSPEPEKDDKVVGDDELVCVTALSAEKEGDDMKCSLADSEEKRGSITSAESVTLQEVEMVQETIRESCEKFSAGKDTPLISTSRKSSVTDSGAVEGAAEPVVEVGKEKEDVIKSSEEKAQEESGTATTSAVEIVEEKLESAKLEEALSAPSKEPEVTTEITKVELTEAKEVAESSEKEAEVGQDDLESSKQPEDEKKAQSDVNTNTIATAVAATVAAAVSLHKRDSEMDTDEDEEVERRYSNASVMGDDRVPDDLDDGEEDKIRPPTDLLIDIESKDAADIETSRESQFGSESKVLDDDQPITDEQAGGEELVLDKDVMTASVVQLDTTPKQPATEESSQLSTPHTEVILEEVKISTVHEEPVTEVKAAAPQEQQVEKEEHKDDKEVKVEEEPEKEAKEKEKSPSPAPAEVKDEAKKESEPQHQEKEKKESEPAPSKDESKQTDEIVASAPLQEPPVKEERPRRSRPAQIPSAIPSKIPRESREVIRTPDEVADLPMHEEVEPGTYETDEFVGDDEGEEDEDELLEGETDGQNEPPLGPDEEEMSEEDHGVEAIEIARSPLPGTLPPTQDKEDDIGSSVQVESEKPVESEAKEDAEKAEIKEEISKEKVSKNKEVKIENTIGEESKADTVSTQYREVVQQKESTPEPPSPARSASPEKDLPPQKESTPEAPSPARSASPVKEDKLDVDDTPAVPASTPARSSTPEETKDVSPEKSLENIPENVEETKETAKETLASLDSLPSELESYVNAALEPIRQTITSVVITPSTPPISVDTTDEADSHFPIPEEVIDESDASQQSPDPDAKQEKVEEKVEEKASAPVESKEEKSELASAEKEEKEEVKADAVAEEKASDDKKEPLIPEVETQIKNESAEIASDEKEKSPEPVPSESDSKEVPEPEMKEIKTPSKYYEEIAFVEEITSHSIPTTTAEQIIEKIDQTRSLTEAVTTSGTTQGTVTTTEEVSRVIDETSGTMTTSFWKEIPSSQAEDNTQKDDEASEKDKLFELPRDDGDDTGGEDGEGEGGEHEEEAEGEGLFGTIQAGLLTAANTASAAVVHQSPESIANIPSSPESGRTPERRESVPQENEPGEKQSLEISLPESATQPPSAIHLEKTPSPISEQEKHEHEKGEKESEKVKMEDEKKADDSVPETKQEKPITEKSVEKLEKVDKEQAGSFTEKLEDIAKLAGGALAVAAGAVVYAVDQVSVGKSDQVKSDTSPLPPPPDTLDLLQESSLPGLISPANTPEKEDSPLEPVKEEEEDEEKLDEDEIGKTTVDEIATTAELVVESAESAVSSAIHLASKTLEESAQSEEEEEEVIEEVVIKKVVERVVTSSEKVEQSTISDIKSATKVIEQIQESMTTISHPSEEKEGEDDGPGVEEEPCTQTIRPVILPKDDDSGLNKNELEESVEKSMDTIYHEGDDKKDESASGTSEQEITKTQRKSVTESISLMEHQTVVEGTEKVEQSEEKGDMKSIESITSTEKEESGEDGDKVGTEAADSTTQSAPASEGEVMHDDVDKKAEEVEDVIDSASKGEEATKESNVEEKSEEITTKAEEVIEQQQSSKSTSAITTSSESSSTVVPSAIMTTEKCEQEIIKQETASIAKVMCETKQEKSEPKDADAPPQGTKPESIKSPTQQLPPDDQQQQPPSQPDEGQRLMLELEGGGGGDGGDGGDGEGGEGGQVTVRKYKQLEDYADKIREAKAVFDTLLNVAKSGVALTSAVDECRKNAQEAIRRSLEAQEDYYKPAKPKVEDVPDTPEEKGMTVYESLEQMAKAGSLIFGDLVDKIEDKERRDKEAKEKEERDKELGIEPSEEEPPAETSTEPEFSAEMAVTIALQHLHETFKTMETLGSPRRSSRHAAKRMCQFHGPEQQAPPPAEEAPVKDNVSVTSSEPEQELEGEEECKSMSSSVLSTHSTKSSMSVSHSAASSSTLAESGVKSPDDDETMRESIASFTSGVISETDEQEHRIIEKSSICSEQKITESSVTEEKSVESNSSSLSQEHSQITTASGAKTDQQESSTCSSTKVVTTSQEQQQTSSSSTTAAAIFSEMRIVKGESTSVSSVEQKTSEKVITSGTQWGSSEEADGGKTTTTTKTVFYGDTAGAPGQTEQAPTTDPKTEPPSGISFKTITTTTTDISPGGTITKTTITRRVSADEEDTKNSPAKTAVGEKSPKVPRRASASGSYSSSRVAAAENKVHAYSYVFGSYAEPDPEEPVDSSISEASEPSYPPPPPASAFAPITTASGPPSDLRAESVTSTAKMSEESSISSTNIALKEEMKGEQVTRTLITTQGDDKDKSNLTTTTTTTRISSDSMPQSSSILPPTSTTTSTANSSSSDPPGTKEPVTRTTRIETVTTSLEGDEPTATTTTVIRTRTESGSSRGSGGGEDQAGSGSGSSSQDVLKEWGKPLGLPTIYPTSATAGSSEGGAEGGSLPGSAGPDSGNFNNTNASSIRATPKKSASTDKTKESGTPAKHGASSSKKSSKKSTKHSPIYVDLAYVPHHGNSHYCDSEFFRMIRARYYVFSGLEPSREVFEGLLQGKQQWEDKNLDVTIIPTYDTDTLGYWVVDSEDALQEAKIDLAPSASRCTINLQDHETSCAAYRLEF